MRAWKSGVLGTGGSSTRQGWSWGARSSPTAYAQGSWDPPAPAESGLPQVLCELVCTDSPLTVAGACGGSRPDSTPDRGEAQAGWGHGPSLGRLGLASPEQ